MGLYQADVARILGVTESTVINWEKDRTKPTLRFMPKVIEFLGCEPSIGDVETLGGRSVLYRRSRGMTQKALAKQIGIDPTTLSRLESNRGRCLPAVLKRVSAFLICHTSGKRIVGV